MKTIFKIAFTFILLPLLFIGSGKILLNVHNCSTSGTTNYSFYAKAESCNHDLKTVITVKRDHSCCAKKKSVFPFTPIAKKKCCSDTEISSVDIDKTNLKTVTFSPYFVSSFQIPKTLKVLRNTFANNKYDLKPPLPYQNWQAVFQVFIL